MSVLLILVSLLALSPEAGASSWTLADPLRSPRDSHTATLLPSGKVLIAGGFASVTVLDGAELYDPASGTSVRTGSLQQARVHHTATLLLSGKVLLVGGDGAAAATAELFDPDTGTFGLVAPPMRPRTSHTATLLPSGKVLVVGGLDGSATQTAELYDPQNGSWELTGESLSDPRSRHTATLLPNEKVLVTGGSTAELYDPAGDTWTPTGALALPCHYSRSTATLLPTVDKVLLVGGEGIPDENPPQLYDWASDSWETDALNCGDGDPLAFRYAHTATLLPSGRVLFVGGQNVPFAVRSDAALYDPESQTWAATTAPPFARRSHTATLLPSGKVLLAGGSDETFDNFPPTYGAGSSPEVAVYAGTSGSWTPTSPLATARSRHTATLLPSGQVLVAGGFGPASPADAEIYDPACDPGGNPWSPAGDLLAARSGHTATLLPSGRVLLAGGGVAGAELYDPTCEIEPWCEPCNPGCDIADVYPPCPEPGDPDWDPECCDLTDTGCVVFPSCEPWSSAGDMHSTRSHHTATLLPSGKVLVAGGEDNLAIASVEIYDPSTGDWTAVESMSIARSGHTATLLPSGRVLVTGGETGDPPFASTPLSSVEIYDPSTGHWTAAESMSIARTRHTATLLPSGRVLVAGTRTVAGAEIFDPESGTWTATGPPAFRWEEQEAVVLPSGLVLVAGGRTVAEFQPATNVAEVYDPVTGAWELTTNPLGTRRFGHTATLLPSGKVIVVGGEEEEGIEFYDSAELYDPETLLPTRRPVITAAPAEIGYVDPASGDPISQDPIAITGTGFRGDSDAGGGNTAHSPVNHPLIQLLSIESAQLTWVDRDPLPLPAGAPPNIFSDPLTLTVSDLPPVFNPGWYLLTVIAAGVASESEIVHFSCGLKVLGPANPDPIPLGESATFEVEALGARTFKWQKCVPDALTTCSDALDEADWNDIPGATTPSYTTPPVAGADSGTQYRAIISSGCTEVASAAATLTVEDSEPPAAAVLNPDGGEYWQLSDADGEPRTELVTWSMSDNIRVCQVDVALRYSTDGGETYTEEAEAGGLPASFGPGATCANPGESTTSLTYTVPSEPPSGSTGSQYKIELTVTDHVGLSTTVLSPNPFYIVQRNDDSVQTLILANLRRMQALPLPSGTGGGMGISDEQAEALNQSLAILATNLQVNGRIIDLGGVTELTDLYAAWDAEPDNTDRANEVLFGCHAPPPYCAAERDGVHDLLRSLLAIYTGVENLVIVGDDRIVPLARIPDRTGLLLEGNYPAGGDLTAGGTTVGQALADNNYLSDDPLAVRKVVRPENLGPEFFVPDLAVGRLVETPEEIITTIATFISQSGLLNLTNLDHKVQVTGYDFLIDSARVIRDRWKAALGLELPFDDASLAPVDGQLVSTTWGLGSVAERAAALREHLSGNGGERYGVLSLNGHATHYREGIPGANRLDIQGLDAIDIYGEDACGNNSSAGPLMLAGAVAYAVGCHGGLPVAGSCAHDDPEHSLDLPQTFLRRGVVAYVANTGYGWGLKHGIGYGEALVKIMSEELSAGGTIAFGEAVKRSKYRYSQKALRIDPFDPYDQKTVMQWTLFGLPMYEVQTGIEAGAAVEGGESRVPFEGPAPAVGERPAVERFGPVTVRRELTGDLALGGTKVDELPQYLTRLDLHFEFSAEGVFIKRDALGNRLEDAPEGCPEPAEGDPRGCYYTLNGLVTGDTDLPLQPYFIYDSRLSGTSQHGTLWKGGVYEEESSWVPIFGELVSNGPDGSDHGAAPEHFPPQPTAPRIDLGADSPECRPTDLELNSLVVPAGEVLTGQDPEARYNIQRRFLEMDLEVFYFNNTANATGNCDRTGPELGSGPFAGNYHQVTGTTIEWEVPETDEAGVWRVLAVYTDGVLGGVSRGTWQTLELADDGSGTWRGSLTLAAAAPITYVLQAVDTRGNVTWLEFTADGGSALKGSGLPSSGVPLGVPLAVAVEVEAGDADLAVDLADAPDPVIAGETLGYTVVVSNQGPDLATAVAVTQVLPVGVSLVLVGGEGWSCVEGSGEVTCTRGTLEVGAAPPIRVFVTPPVVGELTSTATVAALQDDLLPGNDSAAQTTQVILLADLGITKDDGQTAALPGEAISYSLVVTNHGPATVASVTVVDALPAEILGATFTPETGVYDPVTGAWTGLDLGAGESVELVLDGTIDPGASGNLVNTASVSPPAFHVDLEAGNDVATDVDDLTPPSVARVHSVASTGGDLGEGERVAAALTQLLATFSEAVVGAADVGNFVLLGGGADGAVETAACAGAPAGDDEAVPFADIDHDEATRTTALALSGPRALPPGGYRLLVCSGIADVAGHPLAGGDFGRSFEVTVEHLLDNPNLDRDLTGWVPSAPPPGNISHSSDDVDLAPTSGSVNFSQPGGGDELYTLSQCVSPAEGPLFAEGGAFGGRVRIASPSPTSPTVTAMTEVFGPLACDGEPFGRFTAGTVGGDTGGVWRRFDGSSSPEQRQSGSILISYLVTGGDAGSFEVHLDDLELSDRDPAAGRIFADGFESGDLSAWSESVP